MGPRNKPANRVWLRRCAHGAGLLAVAAVLTALTQIGGVVFLLALVLVGLARRRIRPRHFHLPLAFVVLYALASAALVPPLANLGGRTALPCALLASNAPVDALSGLTCVLNRHYTTPAVAAMLAALARDLDRDLPGSRVRYLDAAFPFGLGLPLLPHLSHGDGAKIDLAFLYRDTDGRHLAGRARSPLGYWAFEEPRAGDPAPCRGRDDLLTLRWDIAWLQPLWPDRPLDTTRTAALLAWLAGPGREHGVSKILLEPHLARRLGVEADVVRFQGCRAARHDDHVHVEVAGS